MFERRNQAQSCPDVRKLLPGNSRKQYRSSSSTPFDPELHPIPQGSENTPSRIVSHSHKITPSKRKGNSWQALRPGHLAQGESAKRHTRPEDSEKASGGCGARERISTRTSRGTSRSPRRQRGPARRVQMARKVEDAYFKYATKPWSASWTARRARSVELFRWL